MDRIEELICGLIEDVGMMGMAALNDDDEASLQYRDSALATAVKITEEWREMVKVLEKARWVYDNWADLRNSEIEDMVDELQAVLSHAKDIK